MVKEHFFACLLIPFCAGILLAHLFSISIYFSSALLIFLTIVCVFLRFNKKIQTYYFFLLTFWFLVFGILRHYSHNNFNPITAIAIQENHAWVIKLNKKGKTTEKFYTFIGQIQGGFKQNVLLYLQRGTISPPEVGQTVLFEGDLQLIPANQNPYQFNYSEFMANKRVHYQIFGREFFIVNKKRRSVRQYFSRMKEKISSRLEQKSYNKSSVLLISALVLGDRTQFSYEQKEMFSKAGVMHLLAISGLHVGIIYLILFHGFYWLKLVRKGRGLRIIVSLLFLWVFAAFVDFSPSVCRASLMLTLYFGSKLILRKPNTYHTLALSAFILLIANPNFLFDLGFQLSYSAVFFILWLYPTFRIYLKKENKAIRYFLDIISISLVAQIGTLPLSLHTFHRFSFLFLLGNLVLISLAPLLIVGGIISCFDVLLFTSSNIWVEIYNGFSHSIFWFIEFLSQQKVFIFSSIYFSFFSVLIFYFILILFNSIGKKRYVFYTLLALVIIYQTEKFAHLYKATQTNELIIFHSGNGVVFAIKQGRVLNTYYTNSSEYVNFKSRVLDTYIINEHIKKNNELNIQSILTVKNLRFQLNKSYFLDIISSEKKPIPKLHLQHLQSQAKNSLRYRMINICNHKDYEKCIPEHWNTRKNGAFKLSF